MNRLAVVLVLVLVLPAAAQEKEKGKILLNRLELNQQGLVFIEFAGFKVVQGKKFATTEKADCGKESFAKIIKVEEKSVIVSFPLNNKVAPVFLDIDTKGLVDGKGIKLEGEWKVTDTRKNGESTLFVLTQVK